MLTKYDDIPFKDIASVVSDFKSNKIDAKVLLIDIREPDEITRAVNAFGAETILIRNPNVEGIKSNHADANVENYKYDYIIENGGTLSDLEVLAGMFADYVIEGKNPSIKDSAVGIGCRCAMLIFCKNYEDKK